MAAWCFIESEECFKLEKDGNNTIQVNGVLDCPIAHESNTTVYPVCDNMLVYCINAPSCSGHNDGISYTIGEMQRNPYYIHINETVVPPESVSCPKCTVCPTLTQSMDCPAPTVCPTLTQSMDCPAPTVRPTLMQSMDCPTTVCPTLMQSMDCPAPTVCPTLTQSMDCPAPTVCPTLMQSMDCPTTVCPPLTPTPTIYQTPTTACPTPPEFPSPTKYTIENSTCPFTMTPTNLSRPTIQKLTRLHVGVVLVTLILISLN